MTATKTKATLDVREIPLKQLEVSSNQIQKARRKLLDPASLEELAASIKEKGVLEPILVRVLSKRPKKFEIIAGERRVLAASSVKGLSKIPAIVKDVSEEDALEIQIHENLHRKDLSPMEEAFAYRYFADELGEQISDIAIRVAKSEEYVATRLKLSYLAPDSQIAQDVAAGILPIGHALEIVKHPPAMRAEVARFVSGHEYNPESGTVSLKKFTESIEREILLDLSRAPFSTKSEDLGTVACGDCPNRTGAAPLLFGAETGLGRCQLPECFENKKIFHQAQLRERIAEESEKDVSDVPVVATLTYYNEDKIDERFGESPILEHESGRRHDSEPWIPLESGDCPGAEQALIVTGELEGQSRWLCRASSKCPEHYPPASGSSGSTTGASGSSLSPRELDERRRRKEEILDYKVRGQVRPFALEAWVRLATDDELPNNLGLAAFYKERVSNGRFKVVKWIWALANTRCELGPDDIENVPQLDETDSVFELAQRLGTLDGHLLAKLHRALICFDFGKMDRESCYESQAEVIRLAAEADFDYQLAEAKSRVELCAARQRPAFTSYLDKILEADEKGEERPPVLRVYKTDYNARGDDELINGGK